MTDTKQPEALRLAEKLPKFWNANLATSRDIDQVVAELRRLHEVNESLLAANRDSTNHFDALMADHKKLHEVNQELLEALKEAEDYLRHSANSPDMADKAKAAIAKAEGSV